MAARCCCHLWSTEKIWNADTLSLALWKDCGSRCAACRHKKFVLHLKIPNTSQPNWPNSTLLDRADVSREHQSINSRQRVCRLMGASKYFMTSAQQAVCFILRSDWRFETCKRPIPIWPMCTSVARLLKDLKPPSSWVCNGLYNSKLPNVEGLGRRNERGIVKVNQMITLRSHF